MSWVEVDGARWRWVHGLVIPKQFSHLHLAKIIVSNSEYTTYLCLEHGTIIRVGITCNKIPCYMPDSACRWFIVKKAKIF